jgi:hypothetical protein
MSVLVVAFHRVDCPELKNDVYLDWVGSQLGEFESPERRNAAHLIRSEFS